MKLASRTVLLALTSILLVASSDVALAATFQPIAGTLSIQTIGHPVETTPAVIGSASLFDNPFPPGLDVASASQQASIPNDNRFNFTASASSITSATAPAGGSQATASVSFQQTFSIGTPQWLQLDTQISSPASNPNVFATLTLTRMGQPAPVYAIGDTGGAKTSRQGVAAAGTYMLTGSVATSAPAPGNNTAALSGSLLLTAIADFNGDGVVNGGDLSTWKNGYGSASGAFANGNLDDNPRTDGADFLIWQRQYGVAPPATPIASQVPEPTAGVLALAALAALCRRR